MSFFIKLVLISSLYLFLNTVSAKSNHYENAIQAYYSNNIDAALIHLKNALRDNEQNLPAKLLLAEVLIKKHSYSAAEQELNDAILQGADINLIIEPLGRSLLLQGKFDSVIKLADEKILHSNGRLSFNLLKAKAFQGLKDIVAAEAVYNEILIEHPNNTGTTLELAAIYITQEQFNKAKALLSKAQKKEPNNGRLWQLKGQLARRLSNTENAISFYNKAMVLDPDNMAIVRALASTYIELQNTEKAQTLIDDVLALYPNDIQAQLMKSNILKLQDKDKLSNVILMKLTNQLSAIDENFMLSQPDLLLIDAVSSYGQENWLQSQQKFQKYVNQSSNNIDLSAVVLLADVHVKLNQAQKALNLLSSYEDKIISNKDYALILAGLYLQFNQNFKADYILKRLQQSYKNDEAVLILSAKVLSNTGQDNKALLLLESSSSQKGVNFKHTLAVVSLRLGVLDKAFKYSQSLIELSPEVAEYQLLHIQVLIQLGQLDKAEKSIVALYEKHPDSDQVKFTFALLQFNLNNLTEAKTLFNELVKASPEDGESWFVLAQIEYELGNTVKAIAILEQQTKSDDYRPKALYKLAKVHFAEQEYNESLVVVNTLLQKSRLDDRALVLKAENLIALRQLKTAGHQLDILFGLWSDDARNLLKLSKLQIQVQDFLGAEKSLMMANNKAPNILPIVIDNIKVKIKLEKLSEASALIASAERTGYKKNIYLMILKGDIEMAKNSVSRAFSYYSTALSKDENNTIALIKLAQISQAKQESSKFIGQLGAIVKENPELVLHKHIYADHLFEQNKFEQAKFQYQTLLTQAIPIEKRALALNNLAIIYLDENAYQEAIETAQQAHKMLPAPAIVDTLGWSLVLSGEIAQGLSYLRQAFSMSSTSPEIQYHIAYALVQLNRVGEARMMLLNIIKQPDTFVEYKLAKTLLSEL